MAAQEPTQAPQANVDDHAFKKPYPPSQSKKRLADIEPVSDFIDDEASSTSSGSEGEGEGDGDDDMGDFIDDSVQPSSPSSSSDSSDDKKKTKEKKKNDKKKKKHGHLRRAYGEHKRPISELQRSGDHISADADLISPLPIVRFIQQIVVSPPFHKRI